MPYPLGFALRRFFHPRTKRTVYEFLLRAAKKAGHACAPKRHGTQARGRGAAPTGLHFDVLNLCERAENVFPTGNHKLREGEPSRMIDFSHNLI